MSYKRIPEKYLQKIEVIKKAILVRSQLLSEHGKNVKIEVSNIDYNKDLVYEIIFDLEITGIVSCDDCAHFPEQISEVIEEYIKRVYDASRFALDKNDLSIKNGNSLRGVLVDSFNFNFDEITGLTLSIFFDPAESY
jgi:hypothetical protein